MSGAGNGARNGAVGSSGAVVSGAIVSGAGNGARNGAVGSGAMTSFPGL